MNATLKKVLSSYVTTIVLLVIYALALAVATFIEKYVGTPAAKSWVYYSPFLYLVQILFVVNFIGTLWKYQLHKKGKWGFLILHVAFIIILTGALISNLFGQEGILHLREGESGNQIVIHKGNEQHLHALPFSVELLRFTITRYPGSHSPSSYESDLLFHVDGKTYNRRVFMNNVVDVKGYRFFQASYDRDELGTILSVNQDVAGRNVTYLGYFLMTVGFVFCIIGKNSRFRQLNVRMKALRRSARAGLMLLLLLGAGLPLAAKQVKSPMLDAVQRFPVKPQHAAKFGELPLQSANGRMMPVNTFSSEVLRKLYKNERIGKLTPDQFLLSLLAMPDMWMRIPFIAYSNNDLANYFDLTESYCAYIEMFDSNGNYKLETKLEEAYSRNPADRSAFDKELMKLDEKVNILFDLFNYRRLNIFPLEDDPNHTWFAPGDDLSGFAGQDSTFVFRIMPWYLGEVQEGMKSGDFTKADEVLEMIKTYQEAKNTTLDIDPDRLETEIRYNQLNPFRIAKIGYLSLGGLLLIVTFMGLFKNRRWIICSVRVLWIGVLLFFLYQVIGMAMRWYIGGYAPWSNSYETMIYVGWATVAGGLVFARRSNITFALATLFGGIILFVSGLNWMDPQINTLVPVLKSPWLMFHVAVIVAAYGFFGISFLIGLTNLVLLVFKKDKNSEVVSLRVKELTMANEMSLIFGLALMTIGTFLGAIWANESWGRYWGWDPKETWALITVVIYAIVIHLRLVKRWYNEWLFNVCSILSFASVLMTYFGVNYFLSGMHSYGNNENVSGIFTYLYLVLSIVIILAFFSHRGYKKEVRKQEVKKSVVDD